MRLSAIFFSACLLSTVAHADDIRAFEAAGQTASGYSLGGAVTIDTTTGVVQKVDLRILSVNGYYADLVPDGTSTYGDSYPAEIDEFFVSSDPSAREVAFIALNIPVASFVGFSGAPLCSQTVDCGLKQFVSNITLGSHQVLPLVSGTLTVTPEPSTFALLGTGLLGAVGAVRRKLSR